jgi:hypothetical protein
MGMPVAALIDTPVPPATNCRTAMQIMACLPDDLSAAIELLDYCKEMVIEYHKDKSA